MALNPQTLEQVKSDGELRMKIAVALGKSMYTVDRWLKQNSNQLAAPAVLALISKHLNINKSEALAN